MAIANEIVETSKGVWTWHAFDESIRTELFSTAVLAEDGVVIIDPIDADQGVLYRLGKLGAVAAVVLTNGNHSRAAARFRERFSAPVFAHSESVGELTLPVDGILRVERPLAGSLEVVELHGAGMGEVALRSESGWLHFGDAVINLEDTGLALLPSKYCVDFERLKESLQQLKDLRFENATFAHGVPLIGDAKERICGLV
jgi:hypothetical protein